LAGLVARYSNDFFESPLKLFAAFINAKLPSGLIELFGLFFVS